MAEPFRFASGHTVAEFVASINPHLVPDPKTPYVPQNAPEQEATVVKWNKATGYTEEKR